MLKDAGLLRSYRWPCPFLHRASVLAAQSSLSSAHPGILGVHHLYTVPFCDSWFWVQPVSHKVHHHLPGFGGIGVTYVSKSLISFLSSFSCPLLIQPVIDVSSTNFCIWQRSELYWKSKCTGGTALERARFHAALPYCRPLCQICSPPLLCTEVSQADSL